MRLLTVGRTHLVTGGHPLALPAVDHTASVARGIRVVLDGHVVVDATITAPIDVGGVGWGTSERGLLTDTAAIPDGPKAGQLRRRAVLAPEG